MQSACALLYCLKRRLGGPQRRFGRFGEERNQFPWFFFCILLYSIPASSLLVSLSWLSYILPSVFYLQHTTHMPLAGFELATSASDRPQTLALDRSAIGIGGFEPRTVKPVAKSLYWLSYPEVVSYIIIRHVNLSSKRLSYTVFTPRSRERFLLSGFHWGGVW